MDCLHGHWLSANFVLPLSGPLLFHAYLVKPSIVAFPMQAGLSIVIESFDVQRVVVLLLLIEDEHKGRRVNGRERSFVDAEIEEDSSGLCPWAPVARGQRG